MIEQYVCGHGVLDRYIVCPTCVQQDLDNAKLQVSELQKQVDKCRCCGDPLVCPKRFEDMNRLNGELEARWKQQMQKEAYANQIFLEYEAVVREILANERIHDDKLLARARAIVGPTEKRKSVRERAEELGIDVSRIKPQDPHPPGPYPEEGGLVR